MFSKYGWAVKISLTCLPEQQLLVWALWTWGQCFSKLWAVKSQVCLWKVRTPSIHYSSPRRFWISRSGMEPCNLNYIRQPTWFFCKPSFRITAAGKPWLRFERIHKFWNWIHFFRVWIIHFTGKRRSVNLSLRFAKRNMTQKRLKYCPRRVFSWIFFAFYEPLWILNKFLVFS